MSKFDEEVNKILFEANFLDNVKSTARGVLGGVSDVLGGTLGLAKTGAAMLGSKLSYAEPIENFLKGDNKGETNKQKQ